MENTADFIPDACRAVLIDWLSGLNYSTIAQNRGVSRQRIEQIVSKYVPEKRGRRGKVFPYYPILQQEIRKKFSSVYAFAKAAGLSSSTLDKALGCGSGFRFSSAQLIYDALQTDRPFWEVFKKTEEE